MKSNKDTTTSVLRARHRVLTTTLPKTSIDRGGRHIPQDDAFHHESLSFLIPAVTGIGEVRPPTSSTAPPLVVEHSAKEHTGVGLKRKASNNDEQRLVLGVPRGQERNPGTAVASTEGTARESTANALSEGAGGPNKRGKRFVPKWSDETDRVLRKALIKHGWGCWKRIAESGKLAPQTTPKMIANRAKALGLTRSMFLTPLSNGRAVPPASAAIPAVATAATAATATAATATATVAVATSGSASTPVVMAANKGSLADAGPQTPDVVAVAARSTDGVVPMEVAQKAPNQ